MNFRRITIGTIDDILPDAATKTEKVGTAFFQQPLTERRRLIVTLPEQERNLPFLYAGRVATREEFLARVDSYLASQHAYLTDVSSMSEPGIFARAYIKGTLYKEKEPVVEEKK